ncbi:MAG: peptidoglycan bridge formation glycyltransferase FemA/FemB family protein [Treponema sp.]|nr:peptidoglycan bridge formation glycyltransferase FemA/FemB family protein [Treponema sp.]
MSKTAGCINLLPVSPAELSVCEEASSFLQSAFWGRFKARFGWKPYAFLVEWDAAEEALPAGSGPVGNGNTARSPLLVLSRPLFLGVTFAYVPWGPELPSLSAASDSIRTRALVELAKALRRYLPRSTAFIRFDPPWYREGADALPPLIGKPFSRAPADIQSPDTVIIDLTQDEETLLAGMKEKWRYNVRLSARKGVTLRRSGEEELEVFYRLFEETARRDGIAIHSRDYYAALFALAKEQDGVEARLYIANHEGEDLGAIITLFRGKEGTYLYGASSNNKRNLMAPYLLQWNAMRDAKAFGCERYDLFGIPPTEDPGHPMAGLYRFKTGFGGTIIHRSGSRDFTCRPVVKTLFSLAEGLRKNLRAMKKRRRLNKRKAPGNPSRRPSSTL